jgi:hypothetical protein
VALTNRSDGLFFIFGKSVVWMLRAAPLVFEGITHCSQSAVFIFIEAAARDVEAGLNLFCRFSGEECENSLKSNLCFVTGISPV